ncbi:MAG: FHA domain-containing protein [Candidatus Desantisbacteria bacterium]
MPKIKLTVINGPMKGREYVVSEKMVVSLGRSEDNNFSLPDDQGISRQHACLVSIEEGICFIEKTGRSEIWLDGMILTTKTPIASGDIFTIGITSIQITIVTIEKPSANHNQIEGLQKENNRLKEELTRLQQIRDVNEKYPLMLSNNLCRFALDMDKFFTALVYSLEKVDSTRASHSKSLNQLIDQLLKEDTCDKTGVEIEKYLGDLRDRAISVVYGYGHGASKWFNGLWKKINPSMIEKKLPKKMLEASEIQWWNEYKRVAQDLDPELVEDQIKEIVSKEARDLFRTKSKATNYF